MIDFSGLKIDALLVSGLANIRYLSGFTGDNALLVVVPNAREVLFTDPRFTLQAEEECTCPVRIVKGRDLAGAAAAFLGRRKAKRIGFEAGRITFERYGQLRSGLPLGATLKPLTGVIESLRMVKTAEEIDRIRRSVDTNSRAFTQTLPSIRPGARESEIAAELDYQMRRGGAEQPAFETIVAAGRRTALPHARPGQAALGSNELVLIDMGSFQEGYASDMTRMLSVGKPNQKFREMHAAVLEAQLAAIDAVRDGVFAQKVDRRARQVLTKYGMEKLFIHSTGHGLGLEIHEPPRIGRQDRTMLRAGMAITIEPGVYVKDLGGIRIEDTVLVTKNGCEVLTPTPKEMMVL